MASREQQMGDTHQISRRHAQQQNTTSRHYAGKAEPRSKLVRQHANGGNGCRARRRSIRDQVEINGGGQAVDKGPFVVHPGSDADPAFSGWIDIPLSRVQNPGSVAQGAVTEADAAAKLARVDRPVLVCHGAIP